MSTEIELKYFIEGTDVTPKFTALLEQHSFTFSHQSKKLANTYFDTADRQLRALDFGLRVRKTPDYIEQTIKTAGVIIGGLHKRPEYNVEINEPSPNLSLFPAEIWPQGCNLAQLSASIVPIFDTNFTRESWLVDINDDAGSQVEVAYDKGLITSQGQEQVISELEVELVKGKPEAIFELAALIIEQFNVSAGQQSKAARGYKLWQSGGVAEEVETSYQYPHADLSKELSVEHALVSGMEQGLTALQKAIASTLTQTSLAHLKQVYDALSFIQHGVQLYQDILAEHLFEELIKTTTECIDSLSWLENAIHINDLTIKSGNYRKKLEYSKQLISTLKIERSRFPSEDAIRTILTGQKLNHLQLTLLKFVVSPTVKPSEKTKLLSDFAHVQLDKRLAELKQVSTDKAELSPIEYLVMQHHLYGSLLTGNWFSGLFECEQRQDYRRIWLDVFQGVEELAVLVLLQQQLKATEETPMKLVRWLESKIENLIDALNHSYQTALTVEPYWR